MPKASVNKHGDLLIGKSNVGLAGNFLGVLLPSLQSHSRKQGEKAFFKSRAFAFDSPHGFSSIVRFEIVAHDPIERVVRWATHADTAASHFLPEGSRYAWQSRILRVHIPRRQIP